MTIQTIKVKNGTIALPEKLRRIWQGADVWLQTDNDTIFIKRLTPPSLTLSEMMMQFRQAAKENKITKKDVADAIKWARKKVYNK